MEQKDLKILAQNLANPQGEKGIQIGEMMNETNIGSRFSEASSKTFTTFEGSIFLA